MKLRGGERKENLQSRKKQGAHNTEKLLKQHCNSTETTLKRGKGLSPTSETEKARNFN